MQSAMRACPQMQQQRCAAAPAPAPRPAAAPLPLPRRAPRPAAAKRKGFADEAQAAGLRVNSRGKVSSRPGPLSRKQQQQMPQQPEAPASEAASTSAPAAAAAPRAAAAAAAAPAAAPAGEAYSVPSSTPQVVVDRMARRVAACAIAPVVGGVVALGAFWYLKVIAKLEYPLWFAYLGSTLMFGGGLLGITYGILSTSWDPRREGSFWGWTEARANVGLLMERGKQPGGR
ncbi:hypothetical protein Rsub_12582 [Raphidocelis subcapitata]|uniref:Uncharacterized protein n=1 Tax=Raphidocelis subcapitata TaxID=307507 RepID=A0A2V0PQY3_9CHLO|nr:hypothetical protein Rsub_12582 [Raphidocelis subcapitata]|eukprot:GBF99645.1 hypothetical protein Rsub_12582 [Raphidocelis subcapitata]